MVEEEDFLYFLYGLHLLTCFKLLIASAELLLPTVLSVIVLQPWPEKQMWACYVLKILQSKMRSALPSSSQKAAFGGSPGPLDAASTLLRNFSGKASLSRSFPSLLRIAQGLGLPAWSFLVTSSPFLSRRQTY